MNIKGLYRTICIVLAIVMLLGIGGLLAAWNYPMMPPSEETMAPGINAFKYGLLYITKTESTSGNITLTKTSDTKVTANVALSTDPGATATATVTLYNSTTEPYYFDSIEVLSADNVNIVATPSMEKGDEVPAGSYTTLTLSFGYNGSTANAALNAELNLKFTVEKESVNVIAADIAVQKFADILNNTLSSDDYTTLIDAMDNRDAGWNKGSAISYIGNVSNDGAAGGQDTQALVALFGEELMHLDLDGDGDVDPVTMIIKRENLDNNTATGDTYSYTSGLFNRVTTVPGVEMTIYMTTQDFSLVDNGDTIPVYAATLTKYTGDENWTLILPATLGTAEANNYSNGSYGTANSINTDTWRGPNNTTIKDLIQQTN